MAILNDVVNPTKQGKSNPPAYVMTSLERNCSGINGSEGTKSVFTVFRTCFAIQ